MRWRVALFLASALTAMFLTVGLPDIKKDVPSKIPTTTKDDTEDYDMFRRDPKPSPYIPWAKASRWRAAWLRMKKLLGDDGDRSSAVSPWLPFLRGGELSREEEGKLREVYADVVLEKWITSDAATAPAMKDVQINRKIFYRYLHMANASTVHHHSFARVRILQQWSEAYRRRPPRSISNAMLENGAAAVTEEVSQWRKTLPSGIHPTLLKEGTSDFARACLETVCLDNSTYRPTIEQLRWMLRLDLVNSNVSVPMGSEKEEMRMRMFRRMGWMFRGFVPPLAMVRESFDACVPPEKFDVQFKMEPKRKIRLPPNLRRIPKRKDNRALTQLVMKHVCVSPGGKGLSAMLDLGRLAVEHPLLTQNLSKNRRTWPSTLRVRGFRNEVGVRNNDVHIFQRSKHPSCYHRGTYYWHPIVEPTQNLGHVAYRAAALLDSVRNADAPVLMHIMADAVNNGLLRDNMLRIFYPMIISGLWLATEEENERTEEFDVQEDGDLCVETLVMAWRPIRMYNTLTRPKRSHIIATSYTIPMLRALQHRMLKCFAPSPVNDNSVMRITVGQRFDRKILQLEELLLAFAADLWYARNILNQALPRVSIQVVDFAELTPNQQARIARHTDVFVSNHGAAQVWSLLMRPRSVLVEFVDAAHVHVSMLGLNHFRRYFTENGQTTLAARTHYISHRAGEVAMVCRDDDVARAYCDLKLNPQDFIAAMREATSVWYSNSSLG